jgi:hypothetical protein
MERAEAGGFFLNGRIKKAAAANYRAFGGEATAAGENSVADGVACSHAASLMISATSASSTGETVQRYRIRHRNRPESEAPAMELRKKITAQKKGRR